MLKSSSMGEKKLSSRAHFMASECCYSNTHTHTHTHTHIHMIPLKKKKIIIIKLCFDLEKLYT